MAVAQIEKLNATNYLSWSADMKYLLMKENLWDIIRDSKIVPELSAKITEEEVNKQKVRSGMALALIYMNISAEYRSIIEDIECPVKAWSLIKKNYCPDTRSYHMSLFSSLMEARIRPDETINLFASRLLRIYNQLIRINKDFNEIYLSFQILRYLPSKFDSVVQSILRWEDSRFTFANILEDLILESSRLQLRDEDVHRANIEIQFSQTRSKGSIKCYRCGRPGHLKKNCKSPSSERSAVPVREKSPGRYRPKHQYQRSNTSTYRNQSPECRRSPDRGKFKGKRWSHKDTQEPKDFGNSKSFHSFCITQVCSGETVNKGEWAFDSGASHHFCNIKELFYDFKELKDTTMTVAVQNMSFPVIGEGKIKLQFGKNVVELKNVMFSPNLRRNLISGPMLDINGAKFIGRQGEVKVFNQGQFIFKAILKNGIYILKPKFPVPSDRKVRFELNNVDCNELMKWHKRFGHISPSILIKTRREEGVKGLPELNDKDFSCTICKINKHKRISFKANNFIRSHKPLELIYADVWGPSQVPGRHGERYFLSLIDDFSRKVSLYPIREKADVFDVVRQHITRAETFTGCKLKAFRTDKGREFDNENFKNFFHEKGRET